ncbi:XRE family transcriptional regulator [Actinomadura spongiicola]|uniref:XRE family transcriptional regulator n=1 Tax=Actinomadura spongiicola TaxID=2303421 RepID=A0A372GAV8_9ACTN|nr:XRE family transcriptional regulator [Actinomadura spongiicola]
MPPSRCRASRTPRRAGLLADELAKRIHYSRTKIIRLENASGRPDVADVIRILDVLGVPDDRWTYIVRLASDAAKKGWWDAYGESMGRRQRTYADLESGADTIRSYNPTSVPGALQTPEMIAAMIELAKAEGPTDFSPAKMTKARLRRQEELLRPGGPTYDLVLDEVALRRIIVSEEVLAAQIRHLIDTATGAPQLTVRLLPVDIRAPKYPLPTVPFYVYTYPEADESPVTVVDTVTTNVVHTAPEEVERYTRRYHHLSRVALSPDDSLSRLNEIAETLTSQAGARG